MAKIAPTLAELKNELRIPQSQSYDDSLILGYIAACAEHVYADMHWIKSQQQVVEIDPSKLIGTEPYRLPIRGIDVSTNSSRFIFNPSGIASDVLISSVGAYINNAKAPNRYISFLCPVTNWGDVFIAIHNTSLYVDSTRRPFNIRLPAADAPSLILLAIKKLAVDSYHHNGIASIPVRTAVERLLNPLVDY